MPEERGHLYRRKWVRSGVFWLRYSLFTWLHGNQQTACSSFCVVVVFSFSRVTLSPSSPQLRFSWPLPRIIVIRQNTGWCSVSYDAYTTFLSLGKSNRHYPIRYLSFNMLHLQSAVQSVFVLPNDLKRIKSMTNAIPDVLVIVRSKFVLVGLSSFSQ